MRSKAACWSLTEALKGTRRIHGNRSDQVRFAEPDDLSGDGPVLVLVHSLVSDKTAGTQYRAALLPVSDASTFNCGLRSPASLATIDHHAVSTHPTSSASILPP